MHRGRGVRATLRAPTSALDSLPINWLPDLDQVFLCGASRFGKDELKSQIADLLVDRAFFRRGDKLPRDMEAFASRNAESGERIAEATVEVAKLLPKVFSAFHEARLALEDAAAPSWQHAVDDVRRQWDALLAGRFLVETPWTWLQEFPRYFRAIPKRLNASPAVACDATKTPLRRSTRFGTVTYRSKRNAKLTIAIANRSSNFAGCWKSIASPVSPRRWAHRSPSLPYGWKNSWPKSSA